MMSPFVAVGLVVLAGLVWFVTRRWAQAGPVLALAVLIPLASFAALFWGDEIIMRRAFGAADWARLQHELQAREADLAQYGREHSGLTTSQLVEGYLATHERPPAFQFADPEIPPLHFKISDWRDTVPRVVVSFGCSNNVLFDSATMAVEHTD